MDPNRFDAVVRTLGYSSTRRRALAGLVAAALAGLPGPGGEARRRRGRDRGRLNAEAHKGGGDRGGGTTRATICHKPGTPAQKTLEVDDDAVAGHVGHGDHLGPCCEPPTTFCPTDPDDPATGTCERCCPRCGACQTCARGRCRQLGDGARCEAEGDQGVCCDGICRPGEETCEGCSPACDEPEVCQGNTCVCPGQDRPCPPDLRCCPFAGCRSPDEPCPCPGSGAGGACPPDLQCCPFVGCLPPDEPCPCPGAGGPCPPQLRCCPSQGCIPPDAPCQV